MDGTVLRPIPGIVLHASLSHKTRSISFQTVSGISPAHSLGGGTPTARASPGLCAPEVCSQHLEFHVLLLPSSLLRWAPSGPRFSPSTGQSRDGANTAPRDLTPAALDPMSPASPITAAGRLLLTPLKCAWLRPQLPACHPSAGTLTPNFSGILGVTRRGFGNTRCSCVPSQAGSPKVETHCLKPGDRGQFPVKRGWPTVAPAEPAPGHPFFPSLGPPPPPSCPRGDTWLTRGLN